jgi:hypothetical protein
MTETITQYDTRHGSAYDRGSADAWYGREFDPHYFVGASFQSDRVAFADMTAEEIVAYTAGYRDTPFGQKKWD